MSAPARQSGHVTANGAALHYRLEGPPGAPVVMLCHGLLGSLGMWTPQIRALVRAHRVLRFDNRGHGRSEATPAPYSIEMMTADTLALMDALDIAQVHFVGCSLGGMVAQRLGALHADRVRSLVFVGTLAVMGPPSMWDERVRIARADGTAPLVPVMLERWFTPAFRERRPRAVAPIARGIRATPVEGFVGACRAIQAMDQVALLPRIRVPTLVTAGDADPGVPLEATHAIHAAIPGAELHVVKGARHLLSIERARHFNRVLLAWLAAH